MTTNFELLEAVEEMKIPNFRGIFMRNRLPKKPKTIECGIINLDDDDNLTDFYGSSTGNGTHWTSYLKRGNHTLYFDSFGMPPPKEFQKYVGGEIFWSEKQIQKIGTDICGELCLLFLQNVST